MKKIFVILTVTTIFCFASCSSSTGSNNNQSTGDTSIPLNPTQVQKDSAVLSDDSATIKTAVGNKDEEKSAMQQEKLDAEKLKDDKSKNK